MALLNLSPELQEKVETNEISARAGYELSKLDNDDQQRHAEIANSGSKLTHKNAVKIVRDRQGNSVETGRTKQVFFTEDEIRITVSADRPTDYREIAKALNEALEEVMHRINNNC